MVATQLVPQINVLHAMCLKTYAYNQTLLIIMVLKTNQGQKSVGGGKGTSK